MISELFAKYQLGAIHTADKVTNRASVPPATNYDISKIIACMFLLVFIVAAN